MRRLSLAAQGDGLRGALCLLLDGVVDVLVEVVGALGLVPGVELGCFVGSEEGQVGELLLRIGDDAFEQDLEVTQQALDRLRIEQVRVVLQPHRQPAGFLGDPSVRSNLAVTPSPPTLRCCSPPDPGAASARSEA